MAEGFGVGADGGRTRLPAGSICGSACRFVCVQRWPSIPATRLVTLVEAFPSSGGGGGGFTSKPAVRNSAGPSFQQLVSHGNNVRLDLRICRVACRARCHEALICAAQHTTKSQHGKHTTQQVLNNSVSPSNNSATWMQPPVSVRGKQRVGDGVGRRKKSGSPPEGRGAARAS